MAQTRKYLCGVPQPDCTGGLVKMTNLWRGTNKAHSSRRDAFQCHRRYLLSLGYEQVGSREFAAPNGGPIRILTKVSHFGQQLRWGKEHSRWMPPNPFGCITSC